MANTLIDVIKGYLGDSFSNAATSALGENHDAVTKAVSAIIPTTLTGIGAKLKEDPAFASTLHSEAQNLLQNVHSLNLGSLLSADPTTPHLTQASSFLYNVFGNHTHGIIENIASLSGAKDTSVRRLFDVTSLASLAGIGKLITDHNETIHSLGNYFSTHLHSWTSVIPAGIGSLFGLGSVANAASHTHSASHGDATHAGYHNAEQPEGKKKNFIPLIILTAVILGLLAWWMKGCMGHNPGGGGDTTGPDTTAQTTKPATAIVSDAKGKLDSAGNYIYNVGDTITIKLPNGKELKVGSNSTEAKLYNFLSDPNQKVDTVDKKNGWITMDRLYFETGSTKLTANSKAQLENISLILNAFPASTAKLGGYTDSTGAAAVNEKLSDDRAKAALADIAKDGVSANRLEAKGYGAQYPLADNTTPEGRAQNRRIDIRVTKK